MFVRWKREEGSARVGSVRLKRGEGEGWGGGEEGGSGGRLGFFSPPEAVRSSQTPIFQKIRTKPHSCLCGVGVVGERPVPKERRAGAGPLCFTWAFEERSGRLLSPLWFRAWDPPSASCCEGKSRVTITLLSVWNLRPTARALPPSASRRPRKERETKTTGATTTTSTPSAAGSATRSPSIHPVAASTRRAEKPAPELRAFTTSPQKESDNHADVGLIGRKRNRADSTDTTQDAKRALLDAPGVAHPTMGESPLDQPHTTPTTTNDGDAKQMNGNSECPTGESATTDGAALNKTSETGHDHSQLNGHSPGNKISIQAALAELVTKEVAQFAPLLIGKYYVQDKRAVWAGRWGMTEAAFGENGVTSAFEMKSDEDVYIRTGSDDAQTAHPAFTNAPLAKSSRMENPNVDVVNPVYIGYESDPTVRSALPFDCKYSGFFQIQAVKGKPQTVTEKSVEIRFVHDASRPSQFYVSGTGENRFGVFTLVGLLDKETSELRLYKIYKPKDKEKRTLPKRTRAATRPTLTPAPPKPQPKAVPPPPPMPAPISAPLPHIVAPRSAVSTPMGSDSSLSRGRSERKRVMPAHLRDENVIEHDQVPASLKKCHAILKSLMANPKAGPFLVPVDPVALGIPDYFNVIKEPMDLGTIRQNLEGGFYDDASVFIDHVRLVFDNAMLYNAAHSQVHIFAAKLLDDFEKRIKNLNVKQSKPLDRSYGSYAGSSSIIKLKRERKGEPTHSTKKIKGGRGAKGNSKRAPTDDKEGLIMSLKEDIERLKATLEQLQPAVRTSAPKTSKAASRPFKMEDLTEEELNEPMTQAEKARLSLDIRQLPQDKINRVLQIIAESVPVSKLTNENDEVEIDINSFDTRCLRMLEGYVRENGIGRKRKRPAPKKSSKSAPVSHRLNSAKAAGVNIRQRQEQLKNQLALIEGDGGDVARIGSTAGFAPPLDIEMVKADDSSSDSSSSSSDSSDSDSDSDSESDSDGGAPLQRSPVLVGGPALSQISAEPATVRADTAKKIRDEVTSREPLKVENRGAWSMLAQKDTSNAQSLVTPEENQTSSLWMSARSMEQMKQQKIQQKDKERSDELEAQRKREAEQREKEREESERRKHENEAALRLAQEEKLREAERQRAAQRAVEREKLLQDEDEMEDHHEHTLTEDLESFSSSSFL